MAKRVVVRGLQQVVAFQATTECSAKFEFEMKIEGPL